MRTPSPLSRRFSARPPLWQSVAHRFQTGRDCLASFLAFEAAEVLAGSKPANLVNIANGQNRCGHNLYRLWREFGPAVLSATSLESVVLRDRNHHLLVLLFDPHSLQGLLESRRAHQFLQRAGYPPYEDWREALEELSNRLQQEDFPHEIGLFLGYPLKDVAGFLGWAPLPFTCQGPWKIYGDPDSSLDLARLHRECRGRMIQRLAAASNPLECFGYRPRRGRFPRKELAS